MPLPSPARLMVEVQKAAARGHRLLLQSPLARSSRTRRWADFLCCARPVVGPGEPRQTTLSYTMDGDAYVVIASNGGSPRHPDWYLNLGDHPDAEVEIGERLRSVRAETVTGGERGRLWHQAVRSFGGYARYQARTDRAVPVVRLRPAHAA